MSPSFENIIHEKTNQKIIITVRDDFDNDGFLEEFVYTVPEDDYEEDVLFYDNVTGWYVDDDIEAFTENRSAVNSESYYLYDSVKIPGTDIKGVIFGTFWSYYNDDCELWCVIDGKPQIILSGQNIGVGETGVSTCHYVNTFYDPDPKKQMGIISYITEYSFIDGHMIETDNYVMGEEGIIEDPYAE